MQKTKKYYTVWKGKKIGIFDSREDCKKSIQGFSGAQYKSFSNSKLAKQALNQKYEDYVQKTKNIKKIILNKNIPFEKNSIAVDAACSGNPGLMEYRGVELKNGKEIFYQKFELGTNNIGEFLAIVHGLGYLQKNKLFDIYIYSDSKIAINRINQKKCKTSLKFKKNTENLFEIITKTENRLKRNNYQNKILKRDTKNRGEIPADFGRK